MPDLNSVRADDPVPVFVPERRAWVRYPSNQTTLCQEKTAQTYDLWFMARICDVSPKGMRLLLGHSFELGLEVAIEPIRATQPFGRAIQGRIIYSNEEKRGVWIIGCEFTTPLTAEELALLSETEATAVARS
ncbi:MAG TPA: PilZ domain-containing protein [Gemmataceae bacterium]|nr:PilZ domain-containing protein [Gemmataceae bacterium]